jgi:hypothetical protein
MARTGRPRQDLRQSPIEHVEAFCCLQVERIERKLATRYGFDYMRPSNASVGNVSAGNRSWVLEQNDDMTRPVLMRDGIVETRK